MLEELIRKEKAKQGRKALMKGYKNGFHKLTFKQLDQALTATAVQIEKIEKQRKMLGSMLLKKQKTQSEIWKKL